MFLKKKLKENLMRRTKLCYGEWSKNLAQLKGQIPKSSVSIKFGSSHLHNGCSSTVNAD